MSQTSTRAYHEIKADGTLNRMQHRVWNYLAAFYGKTGEEVDAACGPSAHKRLAELSLLGWAEHCGTVKSPTTGKIVYKWRITSQQSLPYQEPKKPTRAALEATVDGYLDKLATCYDKGFEAGIRAAYAHDYKDMAVEAVLEAQR